MANSKIPNVDLTDTFNTSRVRFNNLLDSVGDVSTLTTAATDVTSAINEHDAELGTITSGAMGTTAGTVSGAIAELDDRLDSINNTQIQSAKLLMNDSSAVSAIKGKLDVHGDLYAGGILYTDQIKSATASEQVFINDTLELQANDINDVNNIHLRTALIHDGDTNTKLEFGTDTIDLHTGGTARVAITNNDVTISENLTVQDSAYVTGNLAVGGNTTIGGTLTVDGEVTFKAGANSNINLGDGDGDNVVFNADVNSSIIPNTDNTYDLGSSTKEWRHGYFDGTVNADALAADSATLGTVKVSDLTNNRVVIAGTSGELEDDTNLTFDGTTFEVGTNFDVDVATGNTNIDGNLDVDGTTDLDATNVDGDLDVTGSFTTITTDGLTEGDNLYYTTARADSDAKNAVSATDAGGDGSFAYNNATGVFTYTGPSATEVRDHFTAGEGIDIASGVISGEDATTSNKGIASFSSDNFAVSSGAVSIKNDGITLGTETTGNYVATIAGTANEITVSGSGSETASVTVSLPDDVIIGNDLTVTNDFTVGGSFTIAGEQRIAAQYIFLQDGTTGTPILNSGITVDRGDEDSAVFQWNETGDYWEAGTKNSLNRLALQSDSATFSNLEISGTLQVDTITSQTGAEQVYINDTLELQANDINDVANIYLRNNLYHDGDTNTYLGFGTDTITLRTGGTDRVEITNTQFILSENLKVNDSAYVTGNLQVGGNTVLQGNLEVQGTTTTVNTETIELADNFILLNSNATGTPSASTDVGIEINRGSSTNATLAWDEGGDYWTVGEGNTNTKSRVVTTGFLNTTDAITYNSSTGQLGHADTSAVGGTLDENNSGQTFIQSASFSFDSYGHVTGASLTSGSATDTNTTYSTSIPSSTTKLRLTGSDATTDDIEFAGSGATTVTRTDASKFTISSTDTNTTYSAGTDLDLTGTTFSLESTLNNVTNMDVTGDFTLDASGDIYFGADGNNIHFTYGGVMDWTWTLNDNASGTFVTPGPFTYQSIGDITLDAATDIILDANGADIFFKDNGVTKYTFNMGANQELDVVGDFTIDGAGDIILDAATDIELNAVGSLLIDVTGNVTTRADANYYFRKDNSAQSYFGFYSDSAASDRFLRIHTADQTDTKNEQVIFSDGNIRLVSGVDNSPIYVPHTGDIPDLPSLLLDDTTDEIVVSSKNAFGTVDLIVMNHYGPDDGDEFTSIKFRAFNKDGFSDGNLEDFAEIAAKVDDNTINTEDGSLLFKTMKAGTMTTGMTLDFNGDLEVQGDVNSLSDMRLKENIETVENGLDLVSQLRGVRYNMIDEEDRKIGVIAQEVEEVLPEVVKTNGEGIKSVDYGKMVGVLIEAIKELKQEIDELKGN